MLGKSVKSLSHQKPQLTEKQQRLLSLMADPLIHISKVPQPGQLPYHVALERRRLALAATDYSEAFNEFGEKLHSERAIMPLEDFDDSAFESKTLSQFWESVTSTNDTKILYCEFLTKTWQEGRITHILDDKVRVISDDGRSFKIHKIYVFIWGEDPFLHLQRLENAHFYRLQAQQTRRLQNYVNKMPIQGLSPFHSALRQEIEELAKPHATYCIVKSLAKETQESIKTKVVDLQLPNLMDDVGRQFLVAQNQILFEQQLERNPAFVSELGLQLAVEEVVRQKIVRFYNVEKSEKIYKYLITPSTRDSFLPSNCQFTESGEPIIDEQSLLLNVGIYLVQNFKNSRTKLNENSLFTLKQIVKSQAQTQNYCEELLQTTISLDFLLKNSLNPECYTEQQTSLFVIHKAYPTPVLPLSSKTLSLEDFRASQFAHQRALKSRLEQTWLGQIRNSIVQQLQDLQFEVRQSIERIQLISQNQANASYKNLKQPNLTKSLISFGKQFQIEVKDRDIYDKMYLKRFLKRVQLQLEDTLRILVSNSTDDFCRMIEHHSKWSVKSDSTSYVISKHEENKPYEDDGELNVCCYRAPIFNIGIIIQQVPASIEERNFLEKYESGYIYGVQCLDPNSKIAVDDEAEKGPEEEIVEQDQPKIQEPDDSELMIHSFQFATNLSEFKTQLTQIYDQGIETVRSISEIESVVLKNIIKQEKSFLASPSQDEFQFEAQRIQIQQYCVNIVQPLNDYLKQFSSYRDLLVLDEDKWASTIKYKAELYLREQLETQGQTINIPQQNLSPNMQASVDSATSMSPQDLRNLVYQQMNQAKKIMSEIPDLIHVGAFIVKNTAVRHFLASKCQRLAEHVQDIVQKIASTKATQIGQLYCTIQKRLQRKCNTIEDACKLEEFIQQKMEKLTNSVKINIQTMAEYHAILDELFVQMSENGIAQRWKTIGYPLDLKNLVNRTCQIVELDKVKFRDQQSQEQNSMAKNIETLAKQVTTFAIRYKSLDEYIQASEETELMTQQLAKIQEKSKLYNQRELLMGLQQTDYSQLDQILKDFEPQELLWKSVSDFRQLTHKVYNEDFKALNGNEIESIVDTLQRNIIKSLRSVKENQPVVKELSEQVKKEITEFKKNVPLVKALRNPGLRRRHWLRISEETGQFLNNLRYINGIELQKFGDDEASETDYSIMSQDEINTLNKQPVNFTFKQAVDTLHLNDMKNFEVIQRISEAASKENTIEQVLVQLEKTWADINFTLMEYQNSGCYILKGLDDVIQTLDDNITMIQSMMFSPFKKFFEKSIVQWEQNLSLTSEIIEAWISVQQAWLYLEPIFSSPDIVRQLPTESKLFRSVDTFWRTHMAKAHKNPNVIQICTETSKLLPNLQENHQSLEKVQKGLADYLETKRIAFPRFFFLSDEELLSILSNTKNPTAVQPFLRSCFENVARIKFIEDNDYQMTSMTSHEGEIVQFVDPLTPSGNVESWMGQLEKLIIRTVQVRCQECFTKYVQAVTRDGVQGRALWVKSGFAQGINLVNQIAFANDTDYAITGQYLEKYRDQLELQLDSMTEIVRTGLTKLESKTYSAVLTYDVFQRDQIVGLIAERVTDVSDFNWLKHPKHICNIAEFYDQPIHGVSDNYYNGPIAAEKYQEQANNLADISSKTENFLVSYNQVLSVLPYAYEYLGNTQRLVITPLTLKIYTTISQSQAMFKFSACSGPAGSGKTETSKQMTNKEFGLVCIVFNCSEGLDLIGIKRMLSGCISTGGCLIMDEINRLSLDVLSVFAQMVLGVQRGLQMCGGSTIRTPPKGKTFAEMQTVKYVFEQAELNLMSTACVIITQNPNYSGRQKLPANLVALFRAVSVMVPNYMKICQIRLYSYGFKKATNLAQKATSVFKLCSEQLSQQSWYDYGMRAINSTIQAAGNIRQELGTLCVQENSQIPSSINEKGDVVFDEKYYLEEQIVLRAITEVNSPKFLQNDSQLFYNILKDLFPGIKQPFIDYNVLIKEVTQVLRSNIMNYLQPDEQFVNKIIDLFMTINLRHGLMTLGSAQSGKAESLYALMHSLNRINRREMEERIEKFIKICKNQPTLSISQVPSLIGEDYYFQKMNIVRLNPKSITMDQLFGQFDVVSKEWQDGVLSTLIRNAVSDYNKHMVWYEQNLLRSSYQGGEITFADVNPKVCVSKNNAARQIIDCCGYIDSLWIESLNTVLDDSKRLCLTSGEIICLSPVMNLVFNMDSVVEASPATISRCAMLYYTSLNIVSVGTTKESVGQLVVTGTLSPDAFIQTWIDRLPDQLRLDDFDPSTQGQITNKSTFITKFNQTEKLSELALRFKELLNQFLVESLAYIKVNCKQLQETMDANLITSLFRILDTFIGELKPNDFGAIEAWQIAVFMRYLEPIFFFSLIWSVGASLADDPSRSNFDCWLRGKISELGYLSDCSIPMQIDDKYSSVFDFMFKYDSYDQIAEKIVQENLDTKNLENLVYSSSITCDWISWSTNLKDINLDSIMLRGIKGKNQLSQISLSELIIPTASNIQQSYLLRRLVSNGYPTLVVGSTGSGKTAVIKNYLLKHETDTKFISPLFLTFSANTQAGQVQQYLDSKVEKRRRGIYGPPVSKKFVLFVDDLNLPMKERYGCINSHEFLRQLICHGGFYDLKEIVFKQIIDTVQLGAMVQSGGSRNPVTQRLLRHYNIINFLELSDTILLSIFDQIVDWWSCKSFSSFSEEIQSPMIQMCRKVVPMGIEVYNSTRTGLLPTPAKTHYTFNLRDLSKLFQGFLMVEPKSIANDINGVQLKPKQCTNNILTLFIHEAQRVFSDRLIDVNDQKWFNQLLDKVLISKLSIATSDILGTDRCVEDILFADFLSIGQDRLYQDVTDFNALQKILVGELNKCNEEGQQMNLVLFKSAVHHLSRVVRILRQSSSNILLIGVGGVGRQSLTRLAAYWLNCDIVTIELKKGYGISEWHEDIKKFVMKSGLTGKQQILLLSDQHIFNDQQLEDISILLNTCDVQAIYEPADLATIYEEASISQICMENQLPVTKPNLYDTYCARVKQNIHLVLCFSPSGTSLRNRLRKFPSLVNCCSIDYMFNWPSDALKDVGIQIFNFNGGQEAGGLLDTSQLEFLGKFIEEQCVLNTNFTKQSIQDKIIEFCVYVHSSIESFTQLYKEEQGRFNHVTPTLFLNLLKLFTSVLQVNYNKINSYKMQLSTGLFKLKETQEKVAQMQIDLTNLQPVLVETSANVDNMMVQLEQDKEQADQTRQIVAREKQVASSKFNECDTIKKDAERDLEQAQPLLDAALEALDKLNKNDFTELGSYNNPPAAVKQCMESVCILFSIKPKKINDPNNVGKQMEDYWDEAKKLLNASATMMTSLRTYDKSNIPADTIKKLHKYINDPEFIPQQMQKKSLAAAGLCAFVIAMYKYYHINLQVIPKRQKLSEAQEELVIVEKSLSETVARLTEVENKIAELEDKFNKAVEQKEQLSLQVDDTAKRLDRAQTLIVSLSGEQVRWQEQLVELDKSIKHILGDNLFGASAVIYQGAFTSDFRYRISIDWVAKLNELQIPTSTEKNGNMKVTDILSDDVTIMNYINQYKLPSDTHSMENSSFMFTSQKYCLLIDPEQQAQQFLKNFYKEQGLEVAKASDKDLLRTLENCIRFGKILLIINVTDEIDPSLNTVLDQNFIKDASNQICVKLGDSAIPYNPSFKLYLCTHLANPNYSAESFVKVTVINFAITQLGLSDQLLGVLVALERPDQEALKASLVVSNSKMRLELKQLSEKVLYLLSTSTGDILQNETLIDTLSLSQKTSKEITEKVKESEITEAEIDQTRQKYVPMSNRASILYFCVQDLVKIEFMYQYSLNWYIQLYTQSIQGTEQCDDLETRLKNLIEAFTLYLYQNICRSLFESHKPLFAFLIALRILKSENKITNTEMKFLLIGSKMREATSQNPCNDWLEEKYWKSICELESLGSAFKGISHSFRDLKAQIAWKDMFESQKPEECALPSPYDTQLSEFQRFLPISTLRPDRVLAYMRIFIEKTLGADFNKPQVFNLEKSYKDSNNIQPILFLLADMADPINDLMMFAEQMRMDKKIQVLSLGRGIEKTALNLVTTFVERGNWCVLQNCHLSVGFLKQLQLTLEALQADPASVHRDFRLWLSAQPTPEFPVAILQNSVKVSVENPNSLKANLLRVWETNITEKQMNEACEVPENMEKFKKLTYSLSLFYSVLLQRKKYGPIGFNTPYPWSAADIGICIQQLPIFLDKYPDIYPKHALQYLFAEINIGGCVTDATDQRCVSAIVEDFLNPSIFQENWIFPTMEQKTSETPEYLLHQLTNGLGYRDYLEYINDHVSIECHPNNLGLNTNSNITSDRQDSNNLLTEILILQTGKLDDAVSKEETNTESAPVNSETDVINSIIKQLPDSFDLEAISLRYPTRFEESLNSLLVQECGRFNVLIDTMQLNLKELVRALRGLTILSSELEDIFLSVMMNKLPEAFAKYSYPSLKPLSSYLQDMNLRISFFRNWIEIGKPGIFHISSFFFAQGYLTSVLQNYARKYTIAIDTIGYNFEICQATIDDIALIENKNVLEARIFTAGNSAFQPDVLNDGSYISGLYLEASRFDMELGMLVEARPRELYSKMPIIRLIPIIVGSKEAQNTDVDDNLYCCPCYRTLARFGTLSTTGHSTNFLLNVAVPCQSGSARHWIKRSVALFASLSD
ncbi:Dynein heavy chain [Spironucleus salmonicida]|uniref:Dynein heavy chain n=1 Tax=Spironucleus salmonicida TaxID=348837 RepID=V6LJN2_9EUKA|nr:Dynein heavy chain [Spironucleus salmonicida]|eukprot:EST44588.1 Dynein heavy chain [Spironucleus salmonicida]